MNDTIEVEKFTTASGLSMAEYVPQDYPKSDVVYGNLPLNVLEARPWWPGLPPLPAVEGAYVAGGFAADLLFNRGQGEAKDIDIFFSGKAAFEATFYRLLNMGFSVDQQYVKFMDDAGKLLVPSEEFDKLPYVELHPPYNFHTSYGGRSVQLVKIRWYDNAEHVIDSFDFTVVQAAFDLGAREAVFNPMGAVDFAQRLIIQHRVESRARVTMRLQKYKDKGFMPTDAFVTPPDPTLISVDMNPVHDTQKAEF